MNELRVFENKEFGEVRTVVVDGEVWFIGKDVAEILGYERPTKAVNDHVDPEDIDAVPIQDSIGRMQNTPVINESGLYSLILSSKLPTAKKFKRWVTSEVLPAIRKHGMYISNNVKEPTLIEVSQLITMRKNNIDSRVSKIATAYLSDFRETWKHIYRAIEKKTNINLNVCLHEYRLKSNDDSASTYNMILHDKELYNITIRVLDEFVNDIDYVGNDTGLYSSPCLTDRDVDIM